MSIFNNKMTYTAKKQPLQSIPKGRIKPITWGKKPKAKPKPVRKQYGDKGYKPASGLGIGY